MGTYLMKIGTGNVYDYWFSWTENSQNIDSNVTNLTVKLYLKRNDGYANSSYRAYNDLPISLSVDGSVRYSTSKANIDTRNSKTVELASWTGNISHNADGTRSVPLEGYFRFPSGTTLSGAWTISTTITLTTIPRASSPSCVTYPNHTQDVGDIGGTITIHMNRASSNFTHTVSYSWASKKDTIGTGVTDNVAWTIPMDFCSDIPAAVGGWGTITVDTYSGSTYIGSKSISFYAHVPSSVKPTISAVSISEATAGLAAKFGGYVLSKSTLAVTITASGVYGSTITGCETNILGVKYSGTSFTSNALSRSGTVDVTVTVYDSRGASCTHTEQISVMDYAPPTISEFSAWRIDEAGNSSDQGTRIAVNMKYTISSLDEKNNRTFDLKYGRSGNTLSSFSSGMAEISYSGTQKFTVSPEISTDNSYIISFALSDYFQTVIETVSIPTGFVLWDIYRTGKGLAFGKVAETDELIDSALPIQAPSFYLTNALGEQYSIGIESRSENAGVTFTKYRDGTLIQKCVISGTWATTDWEQWGSLYCISDSARIQAEFLSGFISPPTVFASIESDYTLMLANAGYASATESPAYYALRPSAPGGEVTYKLTVLAIGRWEE